MSNARLVFLCLLFLSFLLAIINSIISNAVASNSDKDASDQMLEVAAPDSYDPDVVTAGNDVYVVWVEVLWVDTDDNEDNTDIFDVLDDNTDILFRKTTTPKNDNNNFEDILNLSFNTGFSILPKVAASGNNVYVVWDERNDIYFMKSLDYGSTFSSAIKLNNHASSFPDPHIAASGNNVYVVWDENNNISFIASSDSGSTFDSYRKIRTAY